MKLSEGADSMPYVTVIIATKNRAEAIAEIALPGLLRQDSLDFEVSVWDASDDELTKDAALKFLPAFKEKGVNLIYTRAPRAGSASQRNDAVRGGGGDVVFFIDDDCEVAKSGIGTIKDYFDSFKWLKGMGLPLIDKPNAEHKKASALKSIIKYFFVFIFSFFKKGSALQRNVGASTFNEYPLSDIPGVAEWLSGGDMAFRISVFDELQFDERLQRFGGYALGEDYDFSHRVFLHFKQPLVVASGAHVIHHAVVGGRISEDYKRVAAICYNTAIIRRNFNRYKKYPLVPFLWKFRFKLLVSMFLNGCHLRDLVRGFSEYKKALRETV
ncbi:hypothetical protein FACS1894167_09480 [Synergistales bacterium]|nr:hypothetical protein FACS1894167_09480 [Synergistales bacterium]